MGRMYLSMCFDVLLSKLLWIAQYEWSNMNFGIFVCKGTIAVLFVFSFFLLFLKLLCLLILKLKAIFLDALNMKYLSFYINYKSGCDRCSPKSDFIKRTHCCVDSDSIFWLWHWCMMLPYSDSFIQSHIALLINECNYVPVTLVYFVLPVPSST